uniref:Uncharacterized protein n=1 Tax=Arundo donax TaxID=35708 RepID=A0A0A9DAL7_ARUDO
MGSGSYGAGGRTGRRTSRSARSSRGRATCTASTSSASAARCGGTPTSPGSVQPCTGPWSSCPRSASPTRSRRPTTRCLSCSASGGGTTPRRSSPRRCRPAAGPTSPTRTP